jgi:hypothetical protein
MDVLLCDGRPCDVQYVAHVVVKLDTSQAYTADACQAMQ